VPAAVRCATDAANDSRRAGPAQVRYSPVSGGCAVLAGADGGGQLGGEVDHGGVVSLQLLQYNTTAGAGRDRLQQ